MERLREFGSYIGALFENEKLIDGEILWKARAGASREYNVKPDETVNTVMLREEITKGQRVERFMVEGLFDSQWVKLAEGTTIGYKRLLRFGDVTPSKIRLTIQEARDIANISEVGAYYAPALQVDTLSH